MNRKTIGLAVGLLVLGAVEFGLLGASAAGLVGGSGYPLPPIAQRGIVQITPTLTPTATPEGGVPGPHSIELLQPNPAAIECDGAHASDIHVFVRDSTGSPVELGTPVYFSVFNGSATPSYVPTGPDGAHTSVVLYSDSYSQQPNVVVNAGTLETAIRLRCKPNSGCPLSPPASVSPPCASPTATPTPSLCSPPPNSSPPCASPTPTPSPCTGASPPCVTPTSTPSPCNPPGSSSPPCATPTPLPHCAPFVTSSPPCVPPSPPERCADVTGDGRVTKADVWFVAMNLLKRHPDKRADANGDGRINEQDLVFVITQLGRRC